MQKNQVEERFRTSCFAAPDAIIVATDLTDMPHLLPHAIAQATSSDATLCLAHAIPPNRTFVPESGLVPFVDPVKAARDARLMMEGFAQQVREHGLRCITAVRHGDPSDVLTELVNEWGAGRLIISTHGRRGIKRLVLGSAAREILRKIDIPVCAIGPHCKAPSGSGMKRVLHPTDLGSDCETSARLALDLAQYHHAELTLFHVLSSDSGVEPYLDPQYAFEKMQDLIPSSLDEFWTPVHTRVASGQLAEEILRAAAETNVDLIVMGGHSGRSACQTAAGPAYAVVASAPCAVLSFSPPVIQTRETADSVRDLMFAADSKSNSKPTSRGV